MVKQVRKAVFPVGGLGTRFLPATKAMPKEMLPVVDKPLIEYAVDEAKAAGIEEFIFVTGRGKAAIEDHFDLSLELETQMLDKGKNREALISHSAFKPGQVAFTRQQQALGLGHAVWCARNLVGNEPFAVLLADDLVKSQVPCLAQILHHYQKLNYEMSIPTLATKFLNTIFRPKLSKSKDFDDIQSMITDFQMRQVPEYIQSLDDLIPR